MLVSPIPGNDHNSWGMTDFCVIKRQKFHLRAPQPVKFKWLWKILVVATLYFSCFAAQAYPLPALPPDPSSLGANIQRTMALMANSNPQHRNTVRILFYGQSITKDDWSRQVAEDLRTRFPNTHFVIKNRAIGGCASQCLIAPAEHDLYPFYPDLLIFHVYGSHIDYEKIIRKVRETTTAEVLLMTDHYTGPDAWSDRMSFEFIPEFAARYRCGLVDIRNSWLRYLRDHSYSPGKLLTDRNHLNAQGNFLMAELVKQYLIYKPDQESDPDELVKTYWIGKDVSFNDGTLTLPFTGNRIDVISSATNPTGATGSIRIDGRKPSEFPELYSITRPNGQYAADWIESPNSGKDWPWEVGAIMRVRSQAKLEVEDWAVTIRNFRSGTDFDFTVAGSVTGEDGSGSYANNPFISRSGRVVIDQADWWLSSLKNVSITSGFKIRWSVVPNFVDTYVPRPNPDPTIEQTTTLAQGLTNQKHILEIVSSDGQPLPIQAIRVYHPPIGRSTDGHSKMNG
jgi:hypothetical protein